MKVTTHYIAFWALLILAHLTKGDVWPLVLFGTAIVSFLVHHIVVAKERT